MPELPDVVVYLERLGALVGGRRLERVRLASPFVLRTYDPPLGAVEGRVVTGFSRIGKRLVFALEGELFIVIHLMIAGRLRWQKPKSPIPKKLGLAAFDFAEGTLLLTEAGTKKRASIHVVKGSAGLSAFDRGGVEPLEASREQFREALLRENRTLKRVLCDPRLFSGIGNAYSDEILFEARLSPVKRTAQIADEEIARLYEACRTTLSAWLDRLRAEAGDGLPEKVTAFRAGMAVHGRYGQPCPRCETKVQRIRHADNEVNYCPRCQTGGKLLADRALSRLLRSDWPKTVEELEELELDRTRTTGQK